MSVQKVKNLLEGSLTPVAQFMSLFSPVGCLRVSSTSGLHTKVFRLYNLLSMVLAS